MKKLVARTHALGALLLSTQALWLSACGGENPVPKDNGSATTGSVGLALNVAGGVELTTVSYDISGNGFHKSGTLDVSRSSTISAVIGGIPAGNGYVITLSAADANDASTLCSGSAVFGITARQTSVANVRLDCRLPNDNGSVAVNGTENVCPRIDGISVSPAEVAVGGSIALSSSVTDADGTPAPASFSWHATGGTVAQATAADATFTCTGPGSFTVTLDVTDTACGDSASATVTCTSGSAPPPSPTIRVNEVESSGGVPGDWAELVNYGGAPVDLSGYVFRDNDDTHAYVVPSGTVVAPGAYFVLEEADFGFGLGAPDAARLFAPDGTTLVDSYSWTTHATPTTYGRCPDATGSFTTTTSVTKGAKNDCSVAVVINEVESSGGVPGDWVELYNAGGTTVDLTGYVFRDNDDSDAYVLPAGSTIAAGGYLVLDEADFVFGLGGSDSARLFAPDGTTLVDSYTWTAHATTTYGRCPNGTGSFATTSSSTKGTANDCPGVVAAQSWPGTNDVTTVDGSNVFGSNLSGLFYTAATSATPAYLWGVRNGPSTLFRLVFAGGIWTPDSADDWGAGKALHYTDGGGNPDSEDVTFAEADQPFAYIATERNNDVSGTSRPSILRVDASAAGTSLTATHEWALVNDLPVVGANLGLEGITWIPDAFLTAHSFFDESAGRAYAPGDYPNHGSGLFFVGLEANGVIYAYALDHSTSAFQRVATISSGQSGIMSVVFDRDSGYLWAVCDDSCNGQINVLSVDGVATSSTFGRFTLAKELARPSSMPNFNNEGFTLAPDSECDAGQKSVFWADDSADDGHSIRHDTVPCGAF